MKTAFLTGLALLTVTPSPSLAFLPRHERYLIAASPKTVLCARAVEPEERSHLLEEFATYSGEILDPYKILKLPRSAERVDIKQAYRAMSRRYHPDCVMHRDILPGSCNNLEDVREQWERIKLSYEILSDKKSRKRYDRHEALADPGKAVKRAAVDAAFSGVAGVGSVVGKGLFGIGAFAFNQIKNSYEQQQNHADKQATVHQQQERGRASNITTTEYTAVNT